jgi:phosphoribosylamine---glycine ligase
MRFLGIGAGCDLGDMYLRLMAQGHEVRVFIQDFAEHGVMGNMLTRVEDWRQQLDWVRAAGSDGVVLFEGAELGEEKDQLRRDGFQVIGGSAFGDRLENDREFGQAVLAEAGLKTARAWTFQSCEQASAFIAGRPARYVYKLNGNATSSWRNYVAQAPDGSDLLGFLRGQPARLAAIDCSELSFVLMEHLAGVETGVGAYFNGERFLQPACLDWEHKRFFNGDLGELTGEMGTLVTYRDTERVFALTLERLAPRLREANYVGYINLNTIINDDGIWPLELTTRFGYPGFAILDALQPDGWAALFRSMLQRDNAVFATSPGYAVGVVLTVPPFPYRYGYAEISRGLPIALGAGLSDEDRRHLHYGEVDTVDQQLVTSGIIGYVMVVTGVGASVEAARNEAYRRAREVFVPNVRYRTDIGERFLELGRSSLTRLGYLPQGDAGLEPQSVAR